MPGFDELSQQLNDYARQLTDRAIAQSQFHNQRGNTSGAQAASDMIDVYRNNLNYVLKQGPLSGLGQESLGLLQGVIGGDPNARQAFDERIAQKGQLDSQNTELQNFRNKLETQYFGAPGLSLSDALSNPTGDLGGLNTALTKQQHDIFNQELRPSIDMQLGSHGLLDSGANTELQAKALGQLERDRQSNLLQAALGARSQVQGTERADILGDIGAKQEALSNEFALQRQTITMNFQRQLEQERESLTRELANMRGSSSLLQDVLGGVSTAAQLWAAVHTGGSSLALQGALSAGSNYAGLQNGRDLFTNQGFLQYAGGRR